MPDHDEPRGPIAIDSLPWHDWSEGVRYGLRYRILSDTHKGGRKIGVSYEELPPGKQSVPFHYHLQEEEHILALEGEATLRLGGKRYAIKAGDYVGFPAGQRAGHCLINETARPFRFIMIGDRVADDVSVFPDSGKIMVRGFDGAIFDLAARRDYWAGEQKEVPVGTQT